MRMDLQIVKGGTGKSAEATTARGLSTIASGISLTGVSLCYLTTTVPLCGGACCGHAGGTVSRTCRDTRPV